ncbi:MAG: hypothetical protein HQ517_01590 [SAR324 cluster bacterium]|nr:hypothetical protein [SAR324 cluster bacterium]
MRKIIPLLILSLLFVTGCQEENTPIHVIGVSSSGDVKINAGEKITKRGFLESSKKYDVFNENDMVVARIVITQTFPDYSIGTISTRLDGSGVRPNPKNINEGMLCLKTTKQTLTAEKAIYKNQKKAFKRQYKLIKMRAKSGVFESVEKAAQDPNANEPIDYSEIDIGYSRIKVKKN